MRIRPAAAIVLAAALALTGCQRAAAETYPSGPVTMTAGASPGSGFDLTIRGVVEALQQDRIVEVALPIQNRPGASGADFLATMVEQYRGADDQISVTSLSIMLNELRGQSAFGYRDVTMIARLMTEYYVVVTRPDSPFNTLGEVLAAVAADPAGVTVGAANDDRAPFDLLVSAAGGDPASVGYLSFEGGGDQIAALRAGSISVAIGGVSEFVDLLATRELQGLGVLSEQRLPGLDVPTAAEQGFDVTLSNWRGLYGPPEMPPSAVTYWQQALARMVAAPGWQRIADRSGFTTTFMTGAEFDGFLAETQADVEEALAEAGP